MSLAKQDLTDIRGVMLDALDAVVNPRFDRIEAQLDEHSATLAEHGRILNEHGHRLSAIATKLGDIDGRLQALEADLKELYHLVNTPVPFDKTFAKLPPEQQLQKLYAAVVSLADQLHVEL